MHIKTRISKTIKNMPFWGLFIKHWSIGNWYIVLAVSNPEMNDCLNPTL